MIEIIEGRGVGAGKSYYACIRILSHLSAGGTVYASDTFGIKWAEAEKLVANRYGVAIENDQFVTFPEGDIKRLHEVTPQGTPELPVLIVVDECHGELNARDWADKTKKDFFKWLTQSRHDDNDVIFISQSANNIDKQIARLVTYVTRIRNMKNFSFPGIGKWPLRQFVINRFDQDGKTLLERKWIWHDTAIFKCYESKVMRGSHRRLAAAAVPRKQLSNSKTKTNSMAKLIMLVMVCLLGYAGYKWSKGELFGAKKETPPAAVPVTDHPGRKEDRPAPYMKPAKAGLRTDGELNAYVIVNETFRSQVGAGILTTDAGEYTLGRMSVHGLVTGIQDRVARIVQPDGRLAFVVADAKTAQTEAVLGEVREAKRAAAIAPKEPPLPEGAGQPLEPPARQKIMTGGTVRNGKLIPYYANDYENEAQRGQAGAKKELPAK